MTYFYVDYGVELADGTVILAATASVATDMVAAAGPFPRRAVSRAVTCTPRPRSGDAAVDSGPWLPLPVENPAGAS